MADDPTFLASLSDLDKGLIDDPSPAATPTPRPPPVTVAPPPESHHQHRLTPEASAALAAASAALAAFEAPAEPGSVAAATRASWNTPLDVFSPANPDTSTRDPGLQPDAQAVAPDSAWRGRGRLLIIVLMIALMLAGAAGAGGILASRWRVRSRAGLTRAVSGTFCRNCLVTRSQCKKCKRFPTPPVIPCPDSRATA